MTLQVGDPAPPFVLPLIPGEAPLRLSDYFVARRPVVVLFFPVAFSPSCTEEMCRMSEQVASYRQLGAEVLAVSVDSPFTLRRFAEECGARFPLLSDFNREAARAYGVLEEDYFGLKGVARRSAFVIDREGKIAHVWHSSDDGLPDLGELLEALRRVA